MRFNANLASGQQGQKVDIHEAQRWANLENTVNNGIEFGVPPAGGTGGAQGNIKGSWITVTTPVTPDTDFTVTHNLGTTPVGIDVKQKNASCDVYTGSVAATKSEITLRATSAGTNLVLFVH